MRIELQPAFVLHRRPYRETSLLVNFFLREHGCLSAVAKGARTAKSRWRAVLEPFSAVLVSLVGRGELLTLTGAECHGVPVLLSPAVLSAGFYLNELLTGFLRCGDPHPVLFDAYVTALQELATTGLQERILRLFEKKFLAALGYGLPFGGPPGSFCPEADEMYKFYPDLGFQPCGPEVEGAFSGRSLLSLAEERLDDAESLRDAKRLMRLVLPLLPGARPLQSRRLFLAMKKG